MKWLMLFMEIIPLYSDNRINPYIQNAKKQVVYIVTAMPQKVKVLGIY
jgi:hypothetical protein